MADLFETKRRAALLRRLRREGDLSQEAAAEAADLSLSSWRRYEKGEREPDDWTPLAAAVGFTLEAFEAALDAPPPRPATPERRYGNAPLAERGEGLELGVYSRALAGSISPSAEQPDLPDRIIDLSRRFGRTVLGTQLVGDSLYPWGSSGIIAAFDTTLFPRREQGCVVFFKDNSTPLVKLFKSLDDETLVVTELHPVQRDISIDRKNVQSVYAVIDRMEP